MVEEDLPVTREGRQRCWDSRDAYFACLDAAGFLSPGKEGKACGSENEKYQENCAKSWVRFLHRILSI
jgi:cytochrome c oxidase assembly factor 6